MTSAKERCNRALKDGIKEDQLDGYWLYVSAGPVRFRPQVLADWNALTDDVRDGWNCSAVQLRALWKELDDRHAYNIRLGPPTAPSKELLMDLISESTNKDD